MDSTTTNLPELTSKLPVRDRTDSPRIQGFDFPAPGAILTAADFRHIEWPIVVDPVDGAVLNNPVGGLNWPNFVFTPNDPALAEFLRRKLKGRALPIQIIYEHCSDVLGSNPMRLCEEEYWHNAVNVNDDDNTKQWIFFSPTRKTVAATDGGFWKSDGCRPTRVILRRSYYKRKWRYFVGTEESNRPTNWFMNEYYSTKYDGWVLCKIFNPHCLVDDPSRTCSKQQQTCSALK